MALFQWLVLVVNLMMHISWQCASGTPEHVVSIIPTRCTYLSVLVDFFSRAAMTDISGFSVARRAPGDLALHHEPYQPNSLEYKCITSALDIGLSILEQDRSKEVLTEFVLMFDDVTSNSACFKKDEAVARRCTDWFVDQLRANAPIMILDETLGRLEVMAYHPRSLWNGSLVEFPFRQQSVHLNAQVRID